jgi:hypothetical protein
MSGNSNFTVIYISSKTKIKEEILEKCRIQDAQNTQHHQRYITMILKPKNTLPSKLFQQINLFLVGGSI